MPLFLSNLLGNPTLLIAITILITFVGGAFITMMFSWTVTIQLMLGFGRSLLRTIVLGTILYVTLRHSLALQPGQYYGLALAGIFLFDIRLHNFLSFEQQELLNLHKERMLSQMTRGRYDTYALMRRRSLNPGVLKRTNAEMYANAHTIPAASVADKTVSSTDMTEEFTIELARRRREELGRMARITDKL